MQLFKKTLSSSAVLLFILAFAYLTRIYQLYIPTNYMFDEVYHAVTAKLIAHNDPRAFEWWNPPPEPDTAVDWLHPPLAKYTQALSMLAFGENSFGWRFSSVIFGVLAILMVYHLARELFKDDRVALLAAGLASLDGLLLVQSRIAMNDIHLTFFTVLSLYVYLKWRNTLNKKFLFLTGLCLGLTAATKWSGAYVLAAVFGLEILRLLGVYAKNKWKLLTKKYSWQMLLRDIGQWLVAFIIIPPIIYLLSYSMMFLQGKGWHHFVELHRQIWYYQTHLEATHPYQSVPWQWVLNTKPVWYYVSYEGENRADIYASGNTVIYVVGLLAAVASIGIVIADAFSVKKKKFDHFFVSLGQSQLSVLLAPYVLLWVPWIFSPRIMFFYHYTPAVPFLCVMLAYWLVQISSSSVGKKIAFSVVGLALVYFILWYPNWMGIPVSTSFKDAVYLRFENWR